MPYVRLPPATGLALVSAAPTKARVVVGPSVSEPPFLALLPHADAATASAATTAMAVVARDLRLRSTVPPDARRSSRSDVSDRCCKNCSFAKCLSSVTHVTFEECNGGSYGWLRALSITLSIMLPRPIGRAGTEDAVDALAFQLHRCAHELLLLGTFADVDVGEGRVGARAARQVADEDRPTGAALA